MRSQNIEFAFKELTSIRVDMLEGPVMSRASLEKVHPNYRDSAKNLVHYLAFRRRDLRPLQMRLAELGLSSLGRAESHVLATVMPIPTSGQASRIGYKYFSCDLGPGFVCISR